jgi:hypothetical protein
LDKITQNLLVKPHKIVIYSLGVIAMTAEQKRLRQVNTQNVHWYKWGPYLSERQWGTVREDYSSDGNAWDYFSHDQARSRAYRWGEDGLGGTSLLCNHPMER